MSEKSRCAWVGKDPIYIAYHDEEWGVPKRDDRRLFEDLILEGAQAGLSWITILKRRAGYRKAFKCLDPKKVARMSEDDVERLMQDPGIVRNRLKIQSVITNAKAFLSIQKEFGSFSAYLWGHVDNTSLQNNFKALTDVPAQTPLSEAISKDLKKRGCSFVGPTIIYAFMQSIGMVNDHTTNCFRHGPVRKLGQQFSAVPLSKAWGLNGGNATSQS